MVHWFVGGYTVELRGLLACPGLHISDGAFALVCDVDLVECWLPVTQTQQDYTVFHALIMIEVDRFGR